jgi:hypothetical protein
VIDPVPIGPATTASAARARLRPIEAVRALTAVPVAAAALAATDAPATGGGGPAQTEVSSAWAWEPALISRSVHLIGRPILRPGAPDARLPEEALLVGIDFDGIDAGSVQLERPGVTAADSTYPVPPGLSSLDFVPGIPLDAITGIRVSKKGDDPANGSVTLRCTLYGRQFETPRLTVSLGHGTGLGRIARLESDRADRQVELLEHLQANVAHYGQAMFRSLDVATIVGLLAPYTWNGKPLVDLVEPTPVTVAGNFLVLRAPVDAEEDSGVGGQTWAALLDDLGVGSRSDERLVPIATGGVVAEAVLGRSNSAEKLDITRFWNWQDSPAPLTPPEIAPVTTGTRAAPEDLRPGQLGPPVVNITNPTALPDPAGLGAALNALTAANMFRDMSGLAGTQSLAQSAVSGTLGAATAAGQMANETLRAEIQRQMAEMQLAADVAKAAIGVPPKPKKDTAGISGEGAKINHGKSMDDRGVGGGGKGEAAPADAGSGDSVGGGDTGAGDGSSGTDTMTTSGDQMPMSREAAYADESALGYSPSGISGLLGGLPVQPAVFHAGNGGGGSGSGSTKTPPGPAHVVTFDDLLKNKVYPGDADIAKVVASDLTAATHKLIFSGHFSAWTNSPTTIFVSDPTTPGAAPADVQDVLTVVAFHEGVHIHQFVAAKGPPPTYAKMMEFEREANRKTQTWLGTTQAANLIADPDNLASMQAQSKIYADALDAEITRVNKLTLTAVGKDAEFKKFLLGTSKTNTIRKALRAAKLTTDTGDAEPMLPPHAKIADLYH